MTSLDTLKQAAQMRLSGYALDKTKSDANEAFKKHFASLHEDRFSDPLYEPSRLAFVAGFLVAHEAALYAVPIATPEHDAKVRDAALEEAARCADAHSGRPVAGEVMAHAIRYLKSTGADHE